MHGLVFMACAAAACYHLTVWCQTGAYRHLAATAAAVLLATVTSYTGWTLALATAAIVFYAAWQRDPRVAARRAAAPRRGAPHLLCPAGADRGHRLARVEHGPIRQSAVLYRRRD